MSHKHILQPLLALFSYPVTSYQNMAQTTIINSYMYFMSAPSNLQTQSNETTLIKTFTQYRCVVVDPMAGLLSSKFQIHADMCRWCSPQCKLEMSSCAINDSNWTMHQGKITFRTLVIKRQKKIHIFHPKWGWHEGTDAKWNITWITITYKPHGQNKFMKYQPYEIYRRQ
jgi:hypothetical protein